MSEGSDDSFLSRWSRRKVQVRQGVAPELPPPAVAPAAVVLAPVVEPALAAPATVAPEVPAREAPPPAPTMADVEALTPASDFARFVAPGVDSQVKNSAMKKLFADPHYNVMDGLDTYIDDYGRADPIPRAMLRQMVQARMMGLLDDELEEQPAPPVLAPAAGEAAEDPALQAVAPAAEAADPAAAEAVALDAPAVDDVPADQALAAGPEPRPTPTA